MSDEKTDWIINSLSHTIGKDYENYVVTGIWHRLIAKGIILKPVTQQYVRRDNGYALLDLYFPSINVAIECDEGQHFIPNGNEYTTNDRKRESEVLRELGALETMPKLIRINATQSFREIDKYIEDATEEIIKKYQECNCPSWELINPVEYVQQHGQISVNDNLLFRTTADVLNALGARTHNDTPYSQWGSGLAVINDGRFVWFPHLTTDEKATDKWCNYLKDSEHIVEKAYRDKPDDIWCKRAAELRQGHPARYLVFAKAKNSLGQSGYRFMGIFSMEKCNISTPPFITYWKRIAISAEIIIRQ